jgi:hypothetical protein
MRLLLSSAVSLMVVAGTALATPDPDRQYLIIGVSGGLQDGFPERPKMNYHQGLEDETKAIYVGRALVRGYKAFLDVMQPGWRQYVEEPGQPLINSNVFASGCREHANEYWVYLVDARQVMAVLNNEPRFLGITPDTGQVDLTAEETSPAVKDLFLHIIDQHGKTDKKSVAIPLVTALWFQYESHVPSPSIKIKEDGTEVTNFPESLALWAGVNDKDRTAVLGAACQDKTCPVEAKEAEQRYWDGIRAAVRKAEANRPSEQDAKEYGPPFQCKSKVKFGVGNETARINNPFTVDQVLAMFTAIGVDLNFEEGVMKPQIAVD